jgi:hypothetical protein
MPYELKVIKTVDNYVYEGVVISENTYEIVMKDVKIIVPQCRDFEYGRVVHFQRYNIIWHTDK